MRDGIIFVIICGLSAGIGVRLTAWLRTMGYIRQPIGKHGWGLIKDDFKIHHPKILLMILLILSGIFYLIYLRVVQAA